MPAEFIEIDDAIDDDAIDEEVMPHIADGGLVTEAKSSDYNRTWDTLSELAESKTTISVLVVDAGKGGLVVDLGVRGFIPKSQIATRDLNNLERFIGQSLDVKIVEVDREKDRVVLSERRSAEEKRRAERAATLEALSIGQTVVGKVVRIADFGAFVDIGGIDGLLHVSDMAWERIEKPETVVKNGDELELKVLKIEKGGDRISLGLKQMTDDPWTIARRKLEEGQVMEVEVIRLAPFGAIVRVLDGVEGVIPNEDLTNEKRVDSPQGVVEIGQTVTAKLVEFRPRDRRLTLSIRQAIRDRDRKEVRDYMTKQRAETAPPTLGDLFGDVLSKLKTKE